MTRLTRYRVGWVLAVLTLSSLALGVLQAFVFHPAAVVGLALLLLVPGRILGHCWRAFFRGRRALDSGQPDAAVGHFNTFLATLEARPWLRRLVWLGWPGYSADPAAMTWTNLGAAHLRAGRSESARAALERAVQIDPLTPLPWYNLGLLHAGLGDAGAADRAFVEARRLGYRGDRLDQGQQTLAGALARIEGAVAGVGRGGPDA
jgi:tetratricopeptide (TPR) repeat protein